MFSSLFFYLAFQEVDATSLHVLFCVVKIRPKLSLDQKQTRSQPVYTRGPRFSSRPSSKSEGDALGWEAQLEELKATMGTV